MLHALTEKTQEITVHPELVEGSLSKGVPSTCGSFMVRQAHHERRQAHHERRQAHHERRQTHHERRQAHHERRQAHHQRWQAHGAPSPPSAVTQGGGLFSIAQRSRSDSIDSKASRSGINASTPLMMTRLATPACNGWPPSKGTIEASVTRTRWGTERSRKPI